MTAFAQGSAVSVLRRAAAAPAVVAALASGSAVCGGEAAVAGAPARAPDLAQRVDAAIDRGVAWLRSEQSAGGSFADISGAPGAVTAMAWYTLAACDVPADDPAVARAREAARRAYVDTVAHREQGTYAAAVYCLAIAEELLRPAPASGADDARREASLAWLRELATCLEARQDARGTWSYGERIRSAAGRPDHSNTQYALFGLHAARCAGVRVSSATWLRSLRHLVVAQSGAGNAAASTRGTPRGWGYVPGGACTGSMTAGCAGAVVVCRDALAATDALPQHLAHLADTSVRDAVAWIGRRFSVTTNPGDTLGGRGWLHYYLVSLERLGVLAAVESIGGHDWYAEGAEALLAAQSRDGSWRMPGADDARGARAAWVAPYDVLETCWALLFLRRSVPRPRPAATPGAADEVRGGLGRLDRVDEHAARTLVVRASMLAASASDAGARTKWYETIAAAGPRAARCLLVALNADDVPTRAAASAALTAITAVDLGFVADAPDADREAAVARWEAWWIRSERTLRYDAALHRLRAD